MKGRVRLRTRHGVEVIIVMLAAAFTVAHAQVASAPRYTHTELRKMMQEAHTERQYTELASYFRSRQEAYEQQAHVERLEWIRRSQDVTGLTAKYPRPVDSSKNRYEYLTYEAGQMSQRAEHYESLSGKAQ